jgi:very-short-patch-repair endonuclease
VTKLKRPEDHEFYYNTTANIMKLAGELRKNQTKAEKALWQALRKRNLKGHKFRRQHPIGRYIVDFYSHSVKLVIEVDGSIHDILSVKEHDTGREQEIVSLGLHILRFTNKQVLNNLDSVVEEIISALNSAQNEQPVSSGSLL